MKKYYLSFIQVGLLSIFLYLGWTLEEQQAWGWPLIDSIQEIRSHPLDIAMRLFSLGGFELFWFLVPLFIWWGKPKQQRIGSNLFLLLQYCLLICAVLKLIYMEPRPVHTNQNIVHKQSTGDKEYSFPSGHSFATTICWTFLCFAFKWQTVLHIACAFLVVFTAFSRVYFGVHFPHDVIAGIILGLIVAISSDYFVLFSENEDEKEEIIAKEHYSKNKRFWMHIFVWISFSILIFSYFEKEEIGKQLGVHLSMGSIIVSAFLRPFVVLIEEVPNGRNKVLLRLFFGLVPIFILTGIGFAMNHFNMDIQFFMFSFGLFNAFWVLYGGPKTFHKLGWATELKKVKKQIKSH